MKRGREGEEGRWEGRKWEGGRKEGDEGTKEVE
jgi:hypothetical protein